MAKDRELADHERAHTGKPGMKPRHGQDAIGKVSPKRLTLAQVMESTKDERISDNNIASAVSAHHKQLAKEGQWDD